MHLGRVRVDSQQRPSALQADRLEGRDKSGYAPGRKRLLEQQNAPGRAQSTQRRGHAGTRDIGVTELDRAHAVSGFRRQATQETQHVLAPGRVVESRARALRDHAWNPRPTRGRSDARV